MARRVRRGSVLTATRRGHRRCHRRRWHAWAADSHESRVVKPVPER